MGRWAIAITAPVFLVLTSAALGQPEPTRPVQDEGADEICKAIDIAINKLAPKLSSEFVRSDSRIVERILSYAPDYYTFVDKNIRAQIWDFYERGPQYDSIKISGDSLPEKYRSTGYINKIVKTSITTNESDDALLTCNSKMVVIVYKNGTMIDFTMHYGDND